MNPTHRALAAFVLTLAALATTLIFAAGASAPAVARPSLQAVGSPAASLPADDAAGALAEPKPAALAQRRVALAPQATRVPTRVDQRSLDSTPVMSLASLPETPHAHADVVASTSSASASASKAEPEPAVEAEVSNTAADEPTEVEITISQLPDPPDVAASQATETVQVPVPQARPDDPWRAVRECESRGDYSINTGNGFYGAYQFSVSSWNWVAGKMGRQDLVGVRPDRATPADQDTVAQALAFEVSGGGLRHWPVCGRRYGS